jgi:hypothetical protein
MSAGVGDGDVSSVMVTTVGVLGTEVGSTAPVVPYWYSPDSVDRAASLVRVVAVGEFGVLV